MTGQIKLISYGLKNGESAPQVDHVIDCFKLFNPWLLPVYRQRNGLDPEVQAFVAAGKGFEAVFNEAIERAATSASLGFMCHGGKHRSVAMAEIVAKALLEKGYDVKIEHMALPAHEVA